MRCPDTEGFRQRFEMNVRGAQLERLQDETVHQLDDGRVRVHRFAVLHATDCADFYFAFGDVLDHLPEVAVIRAVILLQRGVDLVIARHLHVQLGTEDVLQAVDGVQVRGSLNAIAR